ncbi:MAG: PHP domain-containing protein, partial [Oscillospiraceae bacterium]|nr:PHP domain-containing protein [Oscillospiraceae bacterium]
MPPKDSVAFFDMFTCCADDATLRPVLEKALVYNVKVDKKNRRMHVRLGLPEKAAPAALRMTEEGIAQEFGLASVEVTPVYPETEAPKKAEKKPRGRVIMGRAVREKPTPVRDITLESGRVTVTGDVCACDSREIAKCKAFVLSFDLSDGTGAIRVSRFMKEENAGEIVEAIKPGMRLTVQGEVGLDRYYKDLTLDPKSIVETEKEKREDTSGHKRVELHLHTKMSAMDALTDTKEVVKRAIAWGHPAIAITDHGVCQAFPDAMSAAGDKIKVLYGVEGYYVNDVDDKLCSSGVEGPLPEEFAAFDIETTGLDPMQDRIIEIGAVIMQGDAEVARFCTFVDPGMHIPANITQLTGITDDDVAGAPGQEEAVRQLLGFVGDRPLAAHNAAFDIGFIWEAAGRYGLDFAPRWIDTLTIAQGLLPRLKNHRLDTVSDALALPAFAHHRASDDALAAGRILAALFALAKRQGASGFDSLERIVRKQRTDALAHKRSRPHHIILLARTQAGVKNLYRIVTKSHLEHFRRWPTIPKSLILENRDGLLIGSACEAGEVFSLIADHRSRIEQQRLAAFYDYLEIQPVCNNAFMLSGDRPRARSEEELRDFNRRVVELGDELGKLTVATCDVHFLDPEQEIFRHVLLTAKELDDADRALPLYFRTTDEMLAEFDYLGKERAFEVVVTNTNRIAELCDTVRPLPPAGKLYPPRIENSAQQLKDLVYGRMTELYGEDPPEIIKTRVETELEAILGRGYDVIYMSAQKLVQNSLDDGYLVGSRGSVGSSIVAYMSGITEVNSLPPHYVCPKCCHAEFVTDGSYGCGADMPEKDCPECGA